MWRSSLYQLVHSVSGKSFISILSNFSVISVWFGKHKRIVNGKRATAIKSADLKFLAFALHLMMILRASMVLKVQHP